MNAAADPEGASVAGHGTVEEELKFDMAPGIALPELDGAADGLVAVPLGTRELDAVYHDTADLRLLRAGASLRHRTGEGEPRWTLKLPSARARTVAGESLVRSEFDFPGAADDPMGPVPPEAASLAEAITSGTPMVPVARLRTRRSLLALELRGEPVAELADDEVETWTGHALGEQGPSFRELEVEASGTADPESTAAVTRAVAAVLAGAGARPGDGRSKPARTLGLPARPSAGG